MPTAILLPITALLVVLGLSLLRHWLSQRELESSRRDILDRLRVERSSLTLESASFLPTAESWIARLAGPPEEDFVDPQLREPQALQKTLSRKAAYLRGALAKLSKPDQIAEASASSTKDSFLLCLVDPPDSKTDKAVLAKVRSANYGTVALNVRRFYDAKAGLGVLQPWWEARAVASQEIKALASFKVELSRAPIEEGKVAAAAEVFLLALDEPPEGDPAVAEVDRPHYARLALIDLRAQKLLLRLRRRADPTAIPAATRPIHGRAIVGCALALEVLDTLR